MIKQVLIKKLLLSVVIGVVAVYGDRIENNQRGATIRALTDNIIHGVIGLLCWSFVVLNNVNISSALEVLMCGVFSSLIDVDHFIESRSFHIRDAINLHRRPFLHCSTLALLIVLGMLYCSYRLSSYWLFRCSWIVATAFITHHVRDAARRGLWFWPLGSTPPITYNLYILLEIAVPFCISYLTSSSVGYRNIRLIEEVV